MVVHFVTQGFSMLSNALYKLLQLYTVVGNDIKFYEESLKGRESV